MEVRWQVEIDPFCQRILQKHWPHVPKYGDVREINPTELEPVDLICGGFPCQPVSTAGRQRGIEDDRWLWPEFARFIRELRPRYVLIENVPNLRNVNEGQAMAEVLGTLAACGYDAEWDCIPAAAFGAPHLRYRVFIVAYPERSGLEGSTWGGDDKPWWAPVIFTCRPEAVRGQWEFEPSVGRVAHGVPHRVDRIRALGNAVVPQVAEFIGRRILQLERSRKRLEAGK